MKKTFDFQVERNSWTSVPAAFRKRCPFAPSQTTASIDFGGALLWMGKMSVPLRLPQWWLASQWANVRYIAAADPSPRLRLHPAIDDLDTHQKKVLSDDWGVGFSLQWLASRFGYRNIEHGIAAMQDLGRKKIAKFLRKKKKSGPDKCPDFIAYDAQNKVHIIECKGNQQGPAHCETQIKRGRQQKGNVEFQNEAMVAQRLVTAFAFAGSKSNWQSTLRVEDPPPEGENVHYRIESESVEPIRRSIDRAATIRGLVLAGAYDVAANIFPLETQIEIGAARRLPQTERFVAEERVWIGQSYTLPFPLAVWLNPEFPVWGCRMRFGVSPEFANEIMKVGSAPDSVDSFLTELDLDLRLDTDSDDATPEVFEGQNMGHKAPPRRYASIRNGQTFIADWDLLAE
jgi:hypothetical protein